MCCWNPERNKLSKGECVERENREQATPILWLGKRNEGREELVIDGDPWDQWFSDVQIS